ncbi:MAG: hypothetical protein ACRDIE_19270 [Chloroflexota bacterium]
MERREFSQGNSSFGVSMPVFLGIWLVCAVIAGLIWENLVNGTPGTLVITVPALIVVSLSFGIAGAGLAAAAVGIFRRA